MKKICALFLLLLLAGCGRGDEQETRQTTAGLTVVSSFYPVYLLAQEVTQGAQGVRLLNMAQPQTGCLHEYQMTIADRKMLEQADVLLINGGGMEGFLEQAIAQYPDLRIVDTSEGIALLEETAHTHEADDHDDHDAHNHDHAHEGNAHIWLSPARAAGQAENICRALCDLDEAEQALFVQNTAAFRAETEQLLAEAAEIGMPADTFAAIFHEGFAYLAELLRMETAVEIYADEYQEPSARELAQAAEEAAEHHIRYFLAAEDDGRKYAAVLAAENAEDCIVLDPLTMAQEGSYAQRMRRNLQAVAAYGKERSE